MQDFFMWVGGIIISGLFGLTGWMIKMILGKIDINAIKHNILADRLDEHKLYSANTFTTKQEIRLIRDEVVAHLNRIEDKLDRKADKS